MPLNLAKNTKKMHLIPLFYADGLTKNRIYFMFLFKNMQR